MLGREATYKKSDAMFIHSSGKLTDVDKLESFKAGVPNLDFYDNLVCVPLEFRLLDVEMAMMISSP